MFDTNTSSETGFATFDERSKYATVREESSYNLEDYNITKVLGDTILAEFVDEAEEGVVKRGSLFIPQNEKTKDFYRFARVLLKGPKVSETIEIGDILIVAQASTVGTIGIKTARGKVLFIREDRIFGVVERKAEKEPQAE